MPNGTYGGVRGTETKVGQKTFVSRPTRFVSTALCVFLHRLRDAYHDAHHDGTTRRSPRRHNRDAYRDTHHDGTTATRTATLTATALR